MKHRFAHNGLIGQDFLIDVLKKELPADFGVRKLFHFGKPYVVIEPNKLMCAFIKIDHRPDAGENVLETTGNVQMSCLGMFVFILAYMAFYLPATFYRMHINSKMQKLIDPVIEKKRDWIGDSVDFEV